MTFQEFAERMNLAIECASIESRPDQNADHFSKTATHYRVTLLKDGKPFFTCHYSKGFGHAESWARKNVRRFRFRGSTRDFLIHPLRAGARHRDDSEYVREVRRIAWPEVAPSVTELLESLQCEVASCDVPFQEWAQDCGMSSDSIRAKVMWESCNDTRRALMGAFGKDYDDFLSIEC